MRTLGYIFLTVLVSFFIFPVEFRFLPEINTKMTMALLGGVTYVYDKIKQKDFCIYKEDIFIYINASLVSFWGILSVLYNNTNDYTYASYFISFCVWISSAYFVIYCMRTLHDDVSVKLVCKYLIAVAIFQCVMAIIINLLPIFRDYVNNYIVGFASMHSAGIGLEKAGRLYGIGAALDVAGTRFSAILAMIGVMAYNEYSIKNRIFYIYSFLFVFLFLVGSMISRTTSIGVILTILYLIIATRKQILVIGFKILSLVIIFFLLSAYLYRTNHFFHDNIRFGLEGLFNWIETGTFSLKSTDTLKDMFVMPDNLKTWIIGDGYFNEPSIFDSNYIGKMSKWGLFYKGTDVGYLRFLFYFGSLGLCSFILYFFYVTKVCVQRFYSDRWIFILVLLANYIIWLKVATDIFCIFALFLCLPKGQNLYRNINSSIF